LPRDCPRSGRISRAIADLRRADYDAAVEQFNRVIALDSTTRPPYLKRMLATIQLNPERGPNPVRHAGCVS